MGLPIEYSAILRGPNDSEFPINLEEPGWRDREDVKSAYHFTLQPKPDAKFSIMSVYLGPMADGTPRELIYHSTVYGQVRNFRGEGTQDGRDLFRLYCLGWKAESAAGKIIEVKLWAYPGGSVVLADDPPYVQMLIDHYATLNDEKTNTPEQALQGFDPRP